MKISNRCQYAIKILVDLAHYHGKNLVHIDEISKRQDIPKNYLEQIILTLKKAGFVKSKKGPQGGYELINSPQNITLKEIIVNIEGNLFPTPPPNKDSIEKDIYLDFWAELGDYVDRFLENTSVETLRAKEQKLFESKSLHFEI